LAEHNSGQSFATKPYAPWKLVFYAAFESEELAKRFEKYIKSGSGWSIAKRRFL
jgi:predicted GIY-YIG superfamily endonuclease